MFFEVLLLILPLSAHGVEINIDVSTQKVETSGSDVSIISVHDCDIFQIDEKQLREIIFNTQDKESLTFTLFLLTSGNYPFIDGKYYNYPHRISVKKIRRTITPISAEIIKFSRVPEIVSVKHIVNNSPHKSNYVAEIKQEKQNTISHTWRKGADFKSEMSVEVAVQFGKATASMSYSENWGEDHTESLTTVVGSSSKVELVSGQAVTATLTDERVSMEIAVDYTTYLTGTVKSSYHYPYKGHFYHWHDINELLQIANLPRNITSREIITLDLFTNGRVEIKEKV